MFSWANAYRVPCSALGLVETHARELDMSAFMSRHRILLSLMGNTWPVVNVWVGLPLRSRAIKSAVCQLAASDWKVRYREVFSFIVGKKTRLLVVHSIHDCLSQLCWALIFIPLGLCLPFFLWAFIFLQACTILGIEKDPVLTVICDATE